MLRIRDLHAGYGATPILFGVALEVRAGEAVALLGKNGMGKTTLMKTVIGFLKPTRGSIAFDGHELTRLAPPPLPPPRPGLDRVRRARAAPARAPRHRAPRRRPRAREPAHLPRPHRAREPRARPLGRRRPPRRAARAAPPGGPPR